MVSLPENAAAPHALDATLRETSTLLREMAMAAMYLHERYPRHVAAIVRRTERGLRPPQRYALWLALAERPPAADGRSDAQADAWVEAAIQDVIAINKENFRHGR